MGANKKGKTFSLKKYLAIILPFIALTIVPFGCAHRPQVQLKAEPLPKFTEEELGTVAVVSACFEPQFKSLHKPMTKGKAAVTGALVGFLATPHLEATSYDGLVAALGTALGTALSIALCPVFTAGGAIYGGTEGETKKTIRKTEETLNHCLTDLGTQEMMRERILSLARKRFQSAFVILDQCGPSALDEETSYGSSKGRGIDTVFEISVRKIGLWRELGEDFKEHINPPFSLFMTVSTRLIRVKDDTVLSRRTFRYESNNKQKFTEWAKKDTQLFREELDRCSKSLAEMILVGLFIN